MGGEAKGKGAGATTTVANKACTQLYAEHCILFSRRGVCAFRFTSAMTMLERGREQREGRECCSPYLPPLDYKHTVPKFMHKMFVSIFDANEMK